MIGSSADWLCRAAPRRCPTIGLMARAAVRAAAAFVLLFVLFSCAGADVPSFAWKSASGESLAFRQSGAFPKGRENLFSAARPYNSFTLKKPLEARRGYMLAVEVEVKKENLRLGFALSTAAPAKKDEREIRFAAWPGRTFFYLDMPRQAGLKTLALRVGPLSPDSEGEKKPKDETPLAEIKSVALLPAFRGFERAASEKEASRISDGIAVGRSGADAGLWTIQAPFADFQTAARPADQESFPALTLRYAARADASIAVSAGKKLTVQADRAQRQIVLPASVFPDAFAQPKLSIDIPDVLRIESAFIEALPFEQAFTVDPGVLLLQPRLDPGEDFAWYRWDLLPKVLMFDFKDYAVQDAYLKRLAFFVEKRGFAGRLARDEEIASLHGWNAHDYRAEDVARFFSLAASSSFPLGAEEIRLRDFLVEKGFLSKKGDGYAGRGGALISISQESPEYLRSTFIVHESSHAVFFADSAYRDFCIGLWRAMPREEKWFWLLYFGWMNYDTTSAYLMAAEMQAYLLQQPVRRAEEYFTKTLVARLLERHPELETPLAEYMEKFSKEFEAKARVLDAWLKKTYGFGAGSSFFVR